MIMKSILQLTVSIGFLFTPTDGRKIAGIIKKINKALGKVTYPKYCKGF